MMRVSLLSIKSISYSSEHYRECLIQESKPILLCRALIRTGATGAWAPVKFGQRVPGTRQFVMFNLLIRLILVKLVKKVWKLRSC